MFWKSCPDSVKVRVKNEEEDESLFTCWWVGWMDKSAAVNFEGWRWKQSSGLGTSRHAEGSAVDYQGEAGGRLMCWTIRPTHFSVSLWLFITGPSLNQRQHRHKLGPCWGSDQLQFWHLIFTFSTMVTRIELWNGKIHQLFSLSVVGCTNTVNESRPHVPPTSKWCQDWQNQFQFSVHHLTLWYYHLLLLLYVP